MYFVMNDERMPQGLELHDGTLILKNVWSRGSVALFHSYGRARNAVRRTIRYHCRKGGNWMDETYFTIWRMRPEWFDNDILTAAVWRSSLLSERDKPHGKEATLTP